MARPFVIRVLLTKYKSSNISKYLYYYKFKSSHVLRTTVNHCELLPLACWSCVFFIQQRSKMMWCSAPSNTSNQVIWYTIWKLIPLAKGWSNGLKNGQKWESYKGLNGERYGANLKKTRSLLALIWEAIWHMTLKTCMFSYDHIHYMCTKFRQNLRGSLRNFGWSDMEWPYSVPLFACTRFISFYTVILQVLSSKGQRIKEWKSILEIEKLCRYFLDEVEPQASTRVAVATCNWLTIYRHKFVWIYLRWRSYVLHPHEKVWYMQPFVMSIRLSLEKCTPINTTLLV